MVWKNNVFRMLTLVALLLLSKGLMAQTHYITDDVFIYIHGGPGTQYRILGSIEAGQTITLLNETQNDYSKVRDHKDREGWVKSDLIETGSSLRTRLPIIEAELAQTKSTLAQLDQSSESVAQQLTSSNNQIASLQSELAKVTNERDTANQQLQSIKDNAQSKMWQQGALIAGLGALIGIILVYLPRPQRKQKSRWM
ncbi:TIGR04211 family SH3 domain-containing protein [Shewanella sp. 10N.7]|uniref:TIGR04211 family SH3 domain-containing protein n=1 Tax=Shewanella sp. 10N.7 TaxID=2885093 RepID=UPI001E5B602B|nr:TIGR04211 family SH3 domain-containing protein [Shewanella sp. 10N.7]MCC4834288.1 TIGR04211 family SH3 domain-containing protein [Shewanella sp. 10N.7]